MKEVNQFVSPECIQVYIFDVLVDLYGPLDVPEQRHYNSSIIPMKYNIGLRLQ